MPHRPERGGSTANGQGPSVYARVNGLSEEAASHIMRPSSVGMYSQTAGVVTPLMGSKPWLSAPHPGLRGMLPVLEKRSSADSHERSKHDEDCTVATLATETSADELEKREATANALLLVSTAAVRHDSASFSIGKDESIGSLTATMPLKKRKKHLDFLRRNNDDEKDSDSNYQICHVSPVSHSSVEGRTVSHEEETPERPSRRQHVESQRSQSFDSKESPTQKVTTQELLETAKIHSADDIALPSQAIPHFPTVLHRVLSDPEFAGTVLTWLPDGEAWKVLRWDALRREVLPRYFSELRDENGSGCGTIDAFLWHLTAWGFEEIKDGSAVGAYRHDLFIRGAQKLSNKMQCNFTGTDHGSTPNVSQARTPKKEDRSMLQVPTLAPSDSSLSNKKPRHEEASSADSQTVLHRPSPGPISWTSYRQDDSYTEPKAWGHYYGDHVRAFPGAMYNHHSFQRTMSMDPSPTQGSQYPSVHVRSGRGASRVATGIRSNPSSSPLTTPSATLRSSFPVSNRGKGRRTPCSRGQIADDPMPPKSFCESSASPGLEEAERIGNSVKGVAVAISRKTKRKLPLSRKGEIDDQPQPGPSEKI